MLAPKFVGAVVFVWVIAALLGGLYEMSYLGGPERSLLNTVLFYDLVNIQGLFGDMGLVNASKEYFLAIWQMATFQFEFVTGEMELVRWIIFTPLTAILVYGIVMTVVGIMRGTIGSGA